jgi:hypothetical protein
MRGSRSQLCRTVCLVREAATTHAAQHAQGQVHRQRKRDGRKVLQVEDSNPPSHEHGQGSAEHDDQDECGRLPH